MTRHFRRRPEHLQKAKHAPSSSPRARPDWRCGVYPRSGGRALGGQPGRLLSAITSRRDEVGFIEFARFVAKTGDILKFVKVRGAASTHLVSVSASAQGQRRRYEEPVSSFPRGSWRSATPLCSFNPIYGQGMTVACMGSGCSLGNASPRACAVFARRFFREPPVALIDTPWQIAVGSDLQHPEVQGRRRAQVRFINSYIAKLYQCRTKR